MTRISSPNLVAVGDNCLDVYLNKDLMTTGGNALNVAAQWRRDGLSARYFGVVGTDAEADILLAEIEAVGLSPDDVERRPGETAVTLLRDEFGDRQFLLESLGVGNNYMPMDEHYQAAISADWVHLGTNANKDLVRRLVSDGVRFSVDVSTAHLALPLEGVPLLFASGPDDADAPVEPLIESFKAAGARQIILTCGRRGAFFSDGDSLLHAPSTPVDVVDTCGAGDSFIASFLAAFICEGMSAPEALHKATVAAAQTCLHLGGFPQQPRHIPDWLLSKYDAVISPVEGSNP